MINTLKRPPKLTSKQKEIIGMLLEGNTVKEVAAHYRVSFKSTSKSIGLVKVKFNCRTTYQLIGKVVKENLLQNNNYE